MSKNKKEKTLIKVSNGITEVSNEIKLKMLTFASMVSALTPNVFAEGEGTSAEELVKKLLDYIFGIFKYAGIFIIAYGVFQLVSSMKQEDADGKQKAVMTALVGVMLTGIGTFMGSLGLY